MKNKLVTNETLCQKIEELKQSLHSKEIPLTYKQYADQFGYEVSTVRKKVSKGEIPVKKLRAYAKSIGALVTTGNLINPIINREIKRGKK